MVFFLNQFTGFKYDLYFVNSSFPSNIPPVQKVISPSITDIVLIVILVLPVTSRNGTASKEVKSKVESIIKNIPVLNFQFFCTSKCF